MRILQEFLPKYIRIFADRNLTCSSPLRLTNEGRHILQKLLRRDILSHRQKHPPQIRYNKTKQVDDGKFRSAYRLRGGRAYGRRYDCIEIRRKTWRQNNKSGR